VRVLVVHGAQLHGLRTNNHAANHLRVQQEPLPLTSLQQVHARLPHAHDPASLPHMTTPTTI
jgi:hypothetical protein